MIILLCNSITKIKSSDSKLLDLVIINNEKENKIIIKYSINQLLNSNNIRNFNIILVINKTQWVNSQGKRVQLLKVQEVIKAILSSGNIFSVVVNLMSKSPRVKMHRNQR